MIEFAFRKTKIGLSFTFFALIAVVTVWDTSLGVKVIVALLCCILHELGHISAMCFFGSSPARIIFYAGGIKIQTAKNKLVSHDQEIIILLAGCTVNLLIALMIYILCGHLNHFAYANLFLGIFNLMPVKYFDGGRILNELILNTKIYDFIRGMFIIFLAAVMIKMLILGQVNISLLVTFVYITLAELLS